MFFFSFFHWLLNLSKFGTLGELRSSAYNWSRKYMILYNNCIFVLWILWILSNRIYLKLTTVMFLMHKNQKQYHWKLSSVVIFAFYWFWYNVHILYSQTQNSDYGLYELSDTQMLSNVEWKLLSFRGRYNTTLCSHSNDN